MCRKQVPHVPFVSTVVRYNGMSIFLQGSIEEKIYQRQITKQGLNTVVDFKNEGGGGGVAKFSLEDLKDLFSLHDNTLCDTHDLLGCSCERPDGMEVEVRG